MKRYLSFFLLGFVLFGCSSTSEPTQPTTPNPNPSPSPNNPTIPSTPGTPTDTVDYPWTVWTEDIPKVEPSSTGLTYYVDVSNGDDANAGLTSEAAFKTIATALTKLEPGDTVLLRQGLYRESIRLVDVPSGTESRPITFGSYGDGEVIIDGSTQVGPWEKVSGSVWQVKKTFEPVAVVVDDIPLKQVRQGQGQSVSGTASTAPQDGLAAVTSGSGKWHNGTEFITADMGNVDPNAADVVVPSDNAKQEHVYFYQKDYLRFQGLTIRGSGSHGIWGYGSHITIEDCNIKFNAKSGVFFAMDTASDNKNTDNTVLTSQLYHNGLVNWPRGNNGYAELGKDWPAALAWQGNLRPVARGNIIYMNGGEGLSSYGTFDDEESGSALLEQNVLYDNWNAHVLFDNQPNNIARNNFLYNHPADVSSTNSDFFYVGTQESYDDLGRYSRGVRLADLESSSDVTDANLDNTQIYNNIIVGMRIGIEDYNDGEDSSQNHGLKNTLIANNTIIMPFRAIPNTTAAGIFLAENTDTVDVNKNSNTVIANNIVYDFNEDTLVYSDGALEGITLSNNLYFSAASQPFSIADATYDFATWQATTASETNSLFQDPRLEDLEGFKAEAPTLYRYKSAKPKTTSPALNAGIAQPFTPAVNFELEPRETWNIGAF
ncbi:MAG: hypothetical protein ACRCYY_00105 [Trueperaceae bacterium]